jgi:hypothetical protein
MLSLIGPVVAGKSQWTIFMVATERGPDSTSLMVHRSHALGVPRCGVSWLRSMLRQAGWVETMEIAKPARASNPEPQKRPLETQPDEYCARAMAEAERVVRELSSAASCARRSNPGRPSAADEKNGQSPLVSLGSRRSQVAPPPVDHLRLDRGLDFLVHNDGVVELTEAGFRRLGQAHSAALGVVLEVDGREVLRFPAPNPRFDPCSARKSSEVALKLINKERERHKNESLLPWHAAGTLSRSDVERVERALKEDSDLARRYELVREERAETIRLNEMLGEPSERAMAKLFAAIEAAETDATRTRLHPFTGTPALAASP